SNNVNTSNKSKSPERIPLQVDGEKKELNLNTSSELNSVYKSKTSERIHLREDHKQEDLNNNKTPNRLINITKSISP
ncbi:hypothetical protein, partial [Klebsiella pneumoniae]|uniref:hypothetical protein n=1 Tax=Klebsiella pneumoniae TaxID=573 RepID=UPI0040556252